jgi:plasmid stability protein
MLTVRNRPDDVHRALRARAAQHGRSAEAQVREILARAVKPQTRLRLGDALSQLGRKMGLTNADFELAVKARVAGRGFPTPDGYIAAFATSRGFSVASRETAPYEAAGVTVINPWQA